MTNQDSPELISARRKAFAERRDYNDGIVRMSFGKAFKMPAYFMDRLAGHRPLTSKVEGV